MKIINLFLIVSLLLSSQLMVRAQTRNVYQADLLLADGKSVKTQPVEIVLANDVLEISGKKKSSAVKTIALTSIESADYTYSERPRYTAAALSTIVFGIVALPLFASRTKKNWLAINAEKDSVILQLRSDNYRMLLLEMHSRRVKIADSGDRGAIEKKSKAKATVKN
jgi:hypothetical protein